MRAERSSQFASALMLIGPTLSGGLDLELVPPAVSLPYVEVTASVRTTDRTGVEMEALTAVALTALTLYDMIKAVDPAARIDGIRVLEKRGGKTGVWTPEA